MYPQTMDQVAVDRIEDLRTAVESNRRRHRRRAPSKVRQKSKEANRWPWRLLRRRRPGGPDGSIEGQ
jgi:hypothetical protein